MNLFVSIYFNKNKLKGAICTTADYNICYGLEQLKSKNENVVLIGEDFFLENKFSKYPNIKNFYKKDLKSITYIQGKVQYHNSYPSFVKQYRYIVDVHGWGDLSLSSKGKLNLLLPYAYCYDFYIKESNFTHTDNLYFLPHSVVHKVNFNENPKNTVLISGRGRKNPKRYPMRVFYIICQEKTKD